MTTHSSRSGATLYVDLDGTLIHSDLLIESCLALLQKNALYLLLFPFWLMRGKAFLKQQVARRTELRADLLPYDQRFIRFLREQRADGRSLVLISASDQRLVSAVASHLELFDDALGSTPPVNLSGHRKQQVIAGREGGRPYAYAANHNDDWPVWKDAAQIIAVNTGRRLVRRLADTGRLLGSFPPEHQAGRELIRAMRPHQWLKNLLLFLPLLLTSNLYTVELVIQTTLGFVSFSLCASSVYLTNDLLDLAADRQHHRKRLRPFASGTLTPFAGLIASPVLLIGAFIIALFWLPTYFTVVLALYYLSTLLYSFLLKKVMLVDVVTLAILYTLRIIAGAAAVPIIPSFWLMAFSMFTFMSLAIIKRYTELSWLQETGMPRTEGRGYLAKDLDMMAIFGSTSAFMAVLVFALYINSDEIREQYVTPEVLWFICPVLLYLMSRIWLLAYRGEVHDDPLVFVLKDRISQIAAALGAALLYLAHLDWREGVFQFIL
ncbi:MAG: UbiA family prenyltransferase [Pseudohongiellaceae bacterium]